MGRLMHIGIGAILAATFGIAPLVVPANALERYEERALENAHGARSIQMGVGKSVVLDLPRDAAEIVVGNPAIANAIVRTPRKIYLMGMAQGQTTVFAVDGEGRQFAKYELSIGRDVGELGPLLRAAVPKSDIVARTVNDTIILTGTVASAGDAQRAIDIAKGFAAKKAEGGGENGGGGGVINSLSIRGEDQVMLKVTVAEVSRTVLKQLGVSANPVNGADTLATGGWGSFTNNNPFSINTQLSNATLLLKGPGGTTTTLQAFEKNNVARILAEPTVTAVSGEIAKMFVGGEIAVPGPGGCTLSTTSGTNICAPSIAFKPYGVSLAFTPIVQSEGRIRIHVGTEVTEIDPTTTYSYQGVSVPGFKTRKSETTVELPSGGSIATAGLIQQNNSAAIAGLPGLMNLPVLGNLFRSRDYQRLETELLIVVTPYVVTPIPAKDVARPDDNFNDASDPQGWLLGRINRIYATPNNPELNKNYKGRIGFIHD